MNKGIQHIHELTPRTLEDGEIHIWQARAPENLKPEAGLSVLDDQEIERYFAYKAPGKQAEFLFGRYFLKHVLASYLKQKPSDVRLAINEHKRPYLAAGELQVNLTHSFGGFALIISKKLKVGIDLEFLNRKISIEDGRHVFMPEELHAMKQKTPAAAKQEFLQRWDPKRIHLQSR